MKPLIPPYAVILYTEAAERSDENNKLDIKTEQK
jgi:hypothetical protein